MPKFGLKCFIGSFAVSLVAVFAATKGYFMLSGEDSASSENEYSLAEQSFTPQTIELYSQSEEDPILQKYAALSNKNTVNETKVTEDIAVSAEKNSLTTEQPEPVQDPLYDNIDDTLSVDVSEKPADSETILYQPEEEDDDNDNLEDTQKTSEETVIAENTDIPEVPAEEIAENDEDTDEELQIADASLAPKFMIPLEHDFSNARVQASVSSAAGENQVAMASQNIKIDNLGTTNTAAVTSETPSLESAWDVAEVSNRHLNKNSFNEFNEEHKQETLALDKEANSEAKSENETKVAYKMVKNILIPIPDEIANDENLTPQLSYSEENKKLDAKLKRKNAGNTLDNVRKNTEKAVAEQAPKKTAEENKTLTESIVAYFSSDNKDEKNKKEAEQAKSNNVNDENKSSVFKKLLGKDEAKEKSKNDDVDIIPTELKLSFQPNRAEISGQTLEWLHAFSENALSDEEVKIEIRIDGSNSYELQQKRLNLLYTIFANNGVDYNKINIIFTAREPNSFIIRNVKYLPDGTEKIEVPAVADEQPKGDNPWF